MQEEFMIERGLLVRAFQFLTSLVKLFLKRFKCNSLMALEMYIMI